MSETGLNKPSHATPAVERLAARGDEHDQRPFVANFIEVEHVNAVVRSLDFDVAIVSSVPLVDHFNDVDAMAAPIKSSRRRSDIICTRLDSDAHELIA